eukprot:1817905-Pyramimonas_sp.AAC.1
MSETVRSDTSRGALSRSRAGGRGRGYDGRCWWMSALALSPPSVRTIIGLTSEDHHEASHPSQFPSLGLRGPNHYKPGAVRAVPGAAGRLPILPSWGDAKSLKTGRDAHERAS